MSQINLAEVDVLINKYFKDVAVKIKVTSGFLCNFTNILNLMYEKFVVKECKKFKWSDV